MSISSAFIKLGVGFSLGTGLVYIGIPDETWPQVRDKFFHPIRNSLSSLSFYAQYYSPAEVQRRKSQEIQNSKKIKVTNRIILQDQPTPEEQRKKVQFLNEVAHTIRKQEIASTQLGITKKEREAIIIEVMKKYYPEIFPNYQEVVKEVLDLEAKKKDKRAQMK